MGQGGRTRLTKIENQQLYRYFLVNGKQQATNSTNDPLPSPPVPKPVLTHADTHLTTENSSPLLQISIIRNSNFRSKSTLYEPC